MGAFICLQEIVNNQLIPATCAHLSVSDSLETSTWKNIIVVDLRM